MSDRKGLTLEEMLEAPMQVCLIFEPIQPEPIDFVVVEAGEPKLRLVVNNECRKEPSQC